MAKSIKFVKNKDPTAPRPRQFSLITDSPHMTTMAAFRKNPPKPQEMMPIHQAARGTVIPTKALRTFDFHELEGQKQTAARNAQIHEIIINSPGKPMTPGGESFNEAAKRAIGKIKQIISQKNGNVAVMTHNSMFGLLKLWEEEGQPEVLDKAFREKYTKQDNTNPTGSLFEIKGNNGNIYVARHGETLDNKNGNFRSPNTPLTDKGIEQAKELGDILQEKGITKIYSSDLPRAMETSKIIQSL